MEDTLVPISRSHHSTNAHKPSHTHTTHTHTHTRAHTHTHAHTYARTHAHKHTHNRHDKKSKDSFGRSYTFTLAPQHVHTTNRSAQSSATKARHKHLALTSLMNNGARHAYDLPHPSALLGNTHITESAMKMHPQVVRSMHGSEDHFKSCMQFEQHIAQDSLPWHLRQTTLPCT